MKKITAFILLICLFFTIVGYHFIFRFRIWEAKTQMKAHLRHNRDSKDIIELSFTADEARSLEWEDDHEFRLDGEMYDVVEQYQVKGQLVIRCISDHAETALLNQYLNTTRDHSENKPLKALVQLVNTHFVHPVSITSAPPEKTIEQQFNVFTIRFLTVTLPVRTLPPKAC